MSASLIKELRLKSGAGILDCKLALSENDNDIQKSIDWLRKKGLSIAAKKSGRTAADGLVGIHLEENKAAIIEVNSETDFVSRNENFQNFVKQCSLLSVNSSDVNSLLKMNYDGNNTVEEELTKSIATIGENLSIRRIHVIEQNTPGFIISYTHNSVKENLGKIGVLVSFETNGKLNEFEGMPKQIAMHIAATRPLSLKQNELDKNLVDKERQILTDQTLASGKPKEIVDKIVEGKLKKFFQEVVLEDQIFVVDGKTQIKDLMASYSKKIDKHIKILDFKYFVLGEGIEVEEKDFASEVAETVRN